MKLKTRHPNGQPISRASQLQYGYVCTATNLPEELLRACPFQYNNDDNPDSMWDIAGSLKGGIKPSKSGYLSQQVGVSKLTAMVIPVLKNHIDEKLITYDEIDEIWKDSTPGFRKIASAYIEASLRAPGDPPYLVWNGEKLSDMVKSIPTYLSKTEDWPPWHPFGVGGQIKNPGYGDNDTPERKEANDAIDIAEGQGDLVDDAKRKVDDAQEEVNDAIDIAEGQRDLVDDAKRKVDDAQEEVNDAIDIAEGQGDLVDDAKRKVDDAQEEFDRAKDSYTELANEAQDKVDHADEIDDINKEFDETEGEPDGDDEPKDGDKLGRFEDFLNWIYVTLGISREFKTKRQEKIFHVVAKFGKGITITPKGTQLPRTMNEKHLEDFFNIAKKLGVPECFELLPYEPEQSGLGIRNASYFPVILEYYVNKTEPKTSSSTDVTEIDPREVGLHLFRILKEDDGFTIDEIRAKINRKSKGKRGEIQNKEKNVWHNKTEVDAKIQQLLGLDQDQVERTYPAGRKIFYQIVANQVKNLRDKGVITDWDEEHRSGIWRLTPQGEGIPIELAGKIIENYYVWSVEPHNWKILQEGDFLNTAENPCWGSFLDHEKLNEKGIFGKFIFYVKGSKEIKGIYQSEGKWYKPQYPAWVEDFNGGKSIPGTAERREKNRYRQGTWWKNGFPSRIKLKLIQKGSFDLFDPENAKELKFISPPKDPKRIALSMRPGGKGMPSNFGRSISLIDYEFISDTMTSDQETGDDMKDEDDSQSDMQDHKLVLADNWREEVKKIEEELLIDSTTIYHIIDFIRAGNHILLEGPIGTGKTRLTKLIPKLFSIEGKFQYEAETYTATTEWTTQDVIGGIVPKLKGEEATYGISYGCVVETLRKNDQTMPGTRYWTVIDEFNRAPIDKSFGQLFTALRDGVLRQIPTMSATYSTMKIPSDYRIIGTLNTQDKSHIFVVSNALKSRFTSVRIDIPGINDGEREMYFAAKNALKELDHKNNYEDYIKLHHDVERIDDLSTVPELFNELTQAYWILASVRLFYELGTALLMKIYKIIISEKELVKQYPDLTSGGLDEAITAILIPQVDTLTKAELGAIRALHTENGVVDFFKDVYQNKKREKRNYENAFEKVLVHLQVKNISHMVKAFKKDDVLVDQDWKLIADAHFTLRDKFYNFTSENGIIDFITSLKRLESMSMI